MLIVIDALRFDFVIPERRPAPHKVQWRATRDIIDDAGGLDHVRHRRNISAEEVSEVVHDERWSAMYVHALDKAGEQRRALVSLSRIPSSMRF